MLNLPKRLLIDNKQIDQEFDTFEKLYFRFNKEHFPKESLIPTLAIRFPDFSVNREKFSYSTDVLIPNWIRYGIAYFIVKALPKNIEVSNTERIIDFKVVHDPIDKNHEYYSHQNQGFENYAHCEVQAFEDNSHITKKIPESVKKQFRMELRDQITIMINNSPNNK